jgi:hypothetical protein
MLSSDSVRVAVRVRPFNDREIRLGSKPCIKMQGEETQITSPDGKVFKFTYDYSYWSHDESASLFASQEIVFNNLGRSVLDNAWQGYNTSLFAYGQTGAGKV